MGLKSEIEKLGSLRAPNKRFDEATQLSGALRKLSSEVYSASTVLIEDVDQFVDRCIDEYGSGALPQSASQRDARGIARFLFHRSRSTGEVLAGYDGTFELLDSKLRQRPSAALVRSLIHSFFVGYQPGDVRLFKVVQLLKGIERKDIQELDQNVFRFVHPDNGHARLCKILLADNLNPKAKLASVGIPPELETSALVEAAFALYCDEIAKSQPTDASIGGLLNWALIDSSSSDQNGLNVSNERYARRRINFVHALLKPWVEGSGPAVPRQRP